MTILARVTQKIFASANPGGIDYGNVQFGSTALGTPTATNDVAVLQSLTAYTNGWQNATNSGENLPALSEDNALHYVETYQLAYLFQEGIPEYDTGTTYRTDSIVKQSGTTKLYKSIVDNNTGNALTNGTYWALLGDLANIPTSTPLLAANNLSDVASASTARSNLGLAGVLSSIQTGANNIITVTSNAITVSSTISNYYISTSAPTTLNTINGGQQGQIIYLTMVGTTANYLLLANRANNIVLSGNVNCFLNSGSSDWVALRFDGTNWVEVSRGGYNFNTSMLVEEQQASGTAPSALVGGVTRVLNTTLYNSIYGASVASNQITLPPGTYRAFACGMSYQTGGARAYLYNITTSSLLLEGGGLGQGTTANAGYTNVNGIFYISTITVIELRQYTTGNTGVALNTGQPEIYSSVFLTRIG